MTETKEQCRVTLPWMIRKDMDDVRAIERACFEFPWFSEDFLRCLRQRNCIGLAAKHGERVVGFVIYELHKTRLHVLNLAVHPDWQRRGIGQQIIAKLAGKLSSQRRTRITLEVRETNLDAQRFCKAQGFEAVNVLRDFYEDSDEDAYLFEYRLGETR